MPKGLVLNVDTTKSEFQNPMVELRQGDGNYQSLYVTVTDNGNPFDLTGWEVSFMGTTAGSHKIVDANVTLDSTVFGAFTYTPTKAWGQDEGEFKNAYFKFVKNDETASGASFRVNVLDAVDLTAEEAGDYISVVDVMIDQVKTDMDSKLANTQTTLTNTQNQANVIQSNVNDLNNNVNQLKAQNNNLLTSDNTWSGNNNFTNPIKNIDLSQINVGGRNLYLNSMVLPDNYGLSSNVNVTIEPFNSTTNMWHFVAAQGSGDSIGIYLVNYANGKIPNNSDWSYSADIKGTGKVVQFGIESSDKTLFKGTIGSDWSRISQTGHVDNVYYKNIIMYFDTTNSPLDVYIKLPKLEIGNVPTDWTPAPEDVPSNDTNLVHNTGNETIAGDKTFTGNNTFTGFATFSKPIQGSIGVRNYPLATIAGLSGKLIEYSGKWGVSSDNLSDLPQGGYAIMTVYPYIDNGTSGFVTLQYTGGGFYFSEINGAYVVWKKVANDSEVIHNAGTETISGDKTFTGSTTFSSVINGSINGNAATATKATTSDSATTANDPNAVHLTSNQTISGNNTFTGLTDIQNQKQYKSSFTIGSNTINLTRVGSIVFFNAVTNADIAGGTSAGSIPAGFTPAGDTAFVGVSGTSISYMLFQSSSKDVWIPSTIISTSRFGGTYLTNDPLPS